MVDSEKELKLQKIRHEFLNKWRETKDLKKKTTLRDKETLVPISSAQKRIWLHEQIADNLGGLYCVPIALEIKGSLNIDYLQISINKIINRHESLRTIFIKKNDEVYQKVLDDLKINVIIKDLGNLNDDEFKDIIDNESRVPFEIDKGPNFRVTLFKLVNKEILLLNMHHIVSDGWSLGILVNEIILEYKNCSNKDKVILDQLYMQYADYTLLENANKNQIKLDNEIKFWDNKLKDLSWLELVTDFERPSVQTFNGTKQILRINGSNNRLILNLCKKNNYSIFNILLSTYYILLQRYSQQDDFAIGIPVANRKNVQSEKLIGLFVNTLPIRFNEEFFCTFKDVLNYVKDQLIEVFENDDVQFEELVSLFEKNRNVSYSPLFQVMFILQSTKATIENNDLNIKYSSVDTGTALFDLMLNAIETDDGLLLEITYNNELFKYKTIKKLLNDYQNILISLCENPDDKLSNALETIPLKKIAININLLHEIKNIDKYLKFMMNCCGVNTYIDCNSNVSFANLKEASNNDKLNILILDIKDIIETKDFINDFNNWYHSQRGKWIVLIYPDKENIKTIVEYETEIANNKNVTLITNKEIDMYIEDDFTQNEISSSLAISISRVLINNSQDKQTIIIREKDLNYLDKEFTEYVLLDGEENDDILERLNDKINDLELKEENLILINFDEDFGIEASRWYPSMIIINLDKEILAQREQLDKLWISQSVNKYQSKKDSFNEYLHNSFNLIDKNKFYSNILGPFKNGRNFCADYNKSIKINSNKNVYTEGTTDIEKKLCSIWAEVLDVEVVGIYDNFFYLGGNSLSATRIVTRIRDEFNIDIQLRTLFEVSNIFELSTKLSEINNKVCRYNENKYIINKVDKNYDIPLTPAQKKIYFLSILEKNNPIYNMPGAIEFRGDLNIDVLNKSINILIQRHESLRTKISIKDSELYQEVVDFNNYDLQIIDLSDLSSNAKEEQKNTLMNKESQYSFSFYDGIMIKLLLIKMADDKNILVITIHHIAADGWSIGILQKDLSEIYNSLIHDKIPELDKIKIQYKDYAYWQNNNLEVLKDQLDYWKDTLKDIHSFEIPTDYARKSNRSYHGASYSMIIDAPLVNKLRNFSRNMQVTDYVTLLATFEILLYGLSGDKKTLIGIPIAVRNKREIENTVGLFINTLIINMDLDGSKTFKEFIQIIKDVANGAYSNQDISYEKLMEEIKLDKNIKDGSLVKIMFNYINVPMPKLNFEGLESKFIDISRNTAKFDIDFFVKDIEEEMLMTIEYNCDLYNEETIKFILELFKKLLAKGINEPCKNIKEIRNISSHINKDISNIVKVKNDDFIPYEDSEINQTIIERFFNIAEKFPSNIAVKTLEKQITYLELKERIKEIAKIISKVSNDDKVAIIFDHNISMIEAILGVLASGKSYIPLDPLYPEERLKYIIQDSKVSIILVNDASFDIAKKLSNSKNNIIVNLDNLEKVDGEFTLKNIEPTSLAYVLYTSGSTGNPKGVMQNNINVLRHISNYTNNLKICCKDKLLQVASYCFDASIMDMFGALLNGATLFLYSIKKEGFVSLNNCLGNEDISIFHSTPTVYRNIFENISSSVNLSRIRIIVLGGEEVNKSDLTLYENLFNKECIFINGLGPTECTLAFQNIIEHNTSINYSNIPIGYPVKGVEIELLDDDNQEGVLYGEIVFVSENLSLGYINQIDKTNEAFYIKNGKRCYRTGDIARILPSGEYLYMGRKDLQLKIRGIRVEIGEIENVLKEHDYVEKVQIISKKYDNNENYLAAYVICKSSIIPPESEFKNFLAQKLPSYMIPSTFDILTEFPLTPSGKIDRKELSKIEHENICNEILIEPSSKMEIDIASIWKKVLKTNTVGINQNFFDIGGNSLLMIVLQKEVAEKFKSSLSIVDLYNNPTIKEIANLIDCEKETTSKVEGIRNRNQLQKIAMENQKNRRQNQIKGVKTYE